MTGIQAFLEILASAGVTHLFGNPGTTELPLNAALVKDRRFRYLFGLQEIPVVAMADGYAMASGGLGVVNLHIACGLGNAMGMIYNAFIEGTPLLITAGQQDRRLRLAEPVLDGDLVSVVRPWTKWAYEVNRVQDLPLAVRRAIQIALTPPTGPVFLSLPLDMQLEEAENFDLSPPNRINHRVRPPLEELRQACDLLRQARRPVIVAGSRVTESDAIQELIALAEGLGAPVYAEGTATHGRLPFPVDHPQYRSILPLWSPEIREVLSGYDLLLVVGAPVFRLYIHCEPECPVPEHLRILQLDNHPREIGKTYPVEVGLVGDLKSGLQEMAEILTRDRTTSESTQVQERRNALAEGWHKQNQSLRAEIDRQRSQRPMTAPVFMEALARVLPANVAVVEEAITSHQNIFERLGALRDPKGFFAHRGWALGWGMGCALGVRLAWPDRPVLGLIGDGSAMYGFQALWTAAHEKIPVTFVIANNAQYRILKVCGGVLNMPELHDPRCPGMNLVDPAIDFVGLARSLGVDALRVSEPEALSAVVDESLRGTAPRLVEVPLSV